MPPRELEQNRVGRRTMLGSAGGWGGRGAVLGGPHRGGTGAQPRLGTGGHLPVTLAALYLAAEMGPASWGLFQPVGTVSPGLPSRAQGLCLLLSLPLIGKMQTEQIPQGPWVSARWPWGWVSYYPPPRPGLGPAALCPSVPQHLPGLPGDAASPGFLGGPLATQGRALRTLPVLGLPASLIDPLCLPAHGCVQPSTQSPSACPKGCWEEASGWGCNPASRPCS